ncbi:hypothetical protein ACI78V_04285 [Geodermatophilus sp. SYSU D00742]
MTALPASAGAAPGDPARPFLDPGFTEDGVPPRALDTGALPPGLAAACAAMEDPDMQGLPLERRDYLLLLVVTVLVPALLVLIGVLA